LYPGKGLYKVIDDFLSRRRLSVLEHHDRVHDLTPAFGELARSERLIVVDSIVARLLDAYRDQVVAIGLFGSTGL